MYCFIVVTTYILLYRRIYSQLLSVHCIYSQLLYTKLVHTVSDSACGTVSLFSSTCPLKPSTTVSDHHHSEEEEERSLETVLYTTIDHGSRQSVALVL